MLTSSFLQLNEDKVPISSVAVSLLETISEIIASVAYTEAENPNLLKIGSYLYRVSAVVMELQNSTTDAANILQSLSKTVDLAKDLVSQSQKVAEVRDVIEPLEGVIKQIGEDLGSIPPSMYGNQEWMGITVASLSKEMKSDQIEVTQISQIQLPEKNELEPQAETDLYSISPEDYMESLQSSGIAHLNQIEQSGSTNRKGKQSQSDESSGSSTNFPQVTQYMEPPQYKTFFCPLTKNIMDDPVTIESGVTCEGKVITEWYEKFENLSDVVGPQTGQKEGERASSTDMAMKAAIEDWKERNVMARIKVDRAALSRASSESMVFEALKDLQIMCHKKHYKKLLIQSADMLPLIGKFLEYKDSNVICATLELLLLLAEDDDEGKEMVVMSVDMPIIIRMLSSNHQPVKHTSLLLLRELSRSQSLCEKIGSVTGGILILIAIKYKETSDAFASDKADKILRNLEGSPDNIKRMADNGLMEPLLDHLIEGSEEMKMKMATYLGKFSLGDDSQIQVAERASPSLIKMVQDGNSLTRKAAFKALKKISTHRPNSKVLVEAGIVGVMTEELFPRKIYSERRNSKKEAAAILANVLESGLDMESIQINLHAHTIASDYIVRNIIYLLKKSTPDELNINLIRALLCLTKSEKISATIISVVKETEVSYNLMELINNKNEELGVLAVKLLTKLSPYIGHTLVERLCETSAQPESLIKSPTETTRITEKQAVSANFLAKLPHKSLELNLTLVNKNVVPGVLETLNQMQTSGVRTSRYANYYFEGLVGILVRFTTTLYDHQVLLLARNNNFTSFFTELLTKTSSDEVQRLSAIGLENLSKQSISLSKPPKVKKPNYIKLYFFPTCGSSFSSRHKKSTPLCPVHRGACSSRDTFCLLHANATERLLACLDHENVEVVRAALSAICTLLDDNVDVEKSVNILNGLNTIQFVLNAVREHKHEDLWQKSLWVIERFLMQGGERSVSDISQDGSLIAAFVSAFHHGDGSTRQMAENILGYLNKMPNSRTNHAR